MALTLLFAIAYLAMALNLVLAEYAAIGKCPTDRRLA